MAILVDASSAVGARDHSEKSLSSLISQTAVLTRRLLVRLIRKYKLPAKVNLIPFNPWEGACYETSLPERVQRFSDIVFQAGISAPIRTPRGRDIDAACGQLKPVQKRRAGRNLTGWQKKSRPP